jgi:pimeloyl-ACP methyl ester carboxylesterase
MSTPRHGFVDVSGLKLHYLEWGKPSDEPIILLHGFLDQCSSWRSLVNLLEARVAQSLWIIAPDCRGHGDSGWVGTGGYYHFPDYILDLESIVHALQASRLKLVGHSMGGTISLNYAGAFPERVSKLVLIEGIGPVGMQFSDAPPRMKKWIAEIGSRGRHHFREYSSVEAGARQLQETNPRLADETAFDLASSGMKPTAQGKWVWKFDPLHRTTAPQPFYEAQAIEFLRAIQCPVLIVEGQLSHHRQRSDKQARLDALKNKQFAEIDGAGHMVHQENPAALAQVLAAFFFD